jgi:hypothetical protein
MIPTYTVPRHMTGLTPFPFLAVAGGAGLLGGALLGGAFEHHEQEERQEGYDQGQLSSVT